MRQSWQQAGNQEQDDNVVPRQYLELPDDVQSLIAENPNLESSRDSVASNENDLVSNTLSSLEEQLRQIQNSQYGILPEGVVKGELNDLEAELDQHLADAELDMQQQNEIQGLDSDDGDDETLSSTEAMEIDLPNIQEADVAKMDVENSSNTLPDNLGSRTVEDQQEAVKAEMLQRQEMGANVAKAFNEKRGYGFIPDEQAPAKKNDKPYGIPGREEVNIKVEQTASSGKILLEQSRKESQRVLNKYGKKDQGSDKALDRGQDPTKKT